MRSLSTTAVVLVTGVLAALLIAYVFSNNNAEQDNAPHCVAQHELGQVKQELFRRAAAVRGTNDAAFAAVARYSVIRSASPIYRKHHSGSAKVSCAGSIALDMPPGVVVAGGRPSLRSNVSYELEAGSAGSVRLLSLNKADAIVMGLAAIRQPGQASERLTSAPATDGAGRPAIAEPQPAATPPTPPEVPTSRRAEAQRSPAARERPPAMSQPKSPRPLAAPKAAPRPAPVPGPVSVARTSFNCRYARTGGEIAVCHDPGLASLDRQMAAQFNSALSVARPGQRTMLQRSRIRFLSYRDSCRSDACIADAYRARMQEISGIMNGDW
jgi:hypothetical protein